MAKKLFVGGLSWSTRDAELREVFERFGEVLEAQVVSDRDTGRSRGFGFVTFTHPAEADEAVRGLDGTVLQGRTIRVTESQPKPRMGRPFGRDDRGSRW